MTAIKNRLSILEQKAKTRNEAQRAFKAARTITAEEAAKVYRDVMLGPIEHTVHLPSDPMEAQSAYSLAMKGAGQLGHL